LLHYGDYTPYVPVNLDGNLLPFLLYTGAAVSVLPKGKLLPLLPKPLTSYSCPETRESRSITAFGGHLVAVEGPYVFPVEVLTHKLMHKFYVLDSPTPFIAGFDLLVAAHLKSMQSAALCTRGVPLPIHSCLRPWTPFRHR